MFSCCFIALQRRTNTCIVLRSSLSLCKLKSSRQEPEHQTLRTAYMKDWLELSVSMPIFWILLWLRFHSLKSFSDDLWHLMRKTTSLRTLEWISTESNKLKRVVFVWATFSDDFIALAPIWLISNAKNNKNKIIKRKQNVKKCLSANTFQHTDFYSPVSL